MLSAHSCPAGHVGGGEEDEDEEEDEERGTRNEEGTVRKTT